MKPRQQWPSPSFPRTNSPHRNTKVKVSQFVWKFALRTVLFGASDEVKVNSTPPPRHHFHWNIPSNSVNFSIKWKKQCKQNGVCVCLALWLARSFPSSGVKCRNVTTLIVVAFLFIQAKLNIHAIQFSSRELENVVSFSGACFCRTYEEYSENGMEWNPFDGNENKKPCGTLPVALCSDLSVCLRSGVFSFSNWISISSFCEAWNLRLFLSGKQKWPEKRKHSSRMRSTRLLQWPPDVSTGWGGSLCEQVWTWQKKICYNHFWKFRLPYDFISAR